MKLMENKKFFKFFCIITIFIAIFVECRIGLSLMQSGNKIGIIMLALGIVVALASFVMLIILTVKKDCIKKALNIFLMSVYI